MYCKDFWGDLPTTIHQQLIHVSLNDAAEFTARRLATTSALHRKQKEILSATSDDEKEITALKRPLKESELRLSTLHHRHCSTDAALSSAYVKHEACLKGLRPSSRKSVTRPKPAAMQLPAPAPSGVDPALKPVICSLWPRLHTRSNPLPAQLPYRPRTRASLGWRLLKETK